MDIQSQTAGVRDSGLVARSAPRLVARHKTLRSTLRGLGSRLRREDGAATAEYAVATMAAVGFAGLLVVILRGDEVRGVLTELVRRALSADF